MMLFKQVKQVASRAFLISEKNFTVARDKVMFTYGCIEGKNQYRPIP